MYFLGGEILNVDFHCVFVIAKPVLLNDRIADLGPPAIASVLLDLYLKLIGHNNSASMAQNNLARPPTEPLSRHNDCDLQQTPAPRLPTARHLHRAGSAAEVARQAGPYITRGPVLLYALLQISAILRTYGRSLASSTMKMRSSGSIARMTCH